MESLKYSTANVWYSIYPSFVKLGKIKLLDYLPGIALLVITPSEINKKGVSLKLAYGKHPEFCIAENNRR